MNTHTNKTKDNKSQSTSVIDSLVQRGGVSNLEFVDNRPETITQRKLQEVANNSLQIKQLKAFQEMANTSLFIRPNVIQRMMRSKVSYKSDDAAEARTWREDDRGIGGRNIATLYYKEKATESTMATSEHSLNKHSEKLIMEELVNLYGEDYKDKLEFDTLYTERDACGSDYHNCRQQVPTWFPGVKVTYSAEYPSEGEMSDASAESSSEETRATHRRKKAKKARAKGTRKVKKADRHAGRVASGEINWSDFEDSADDS